MKLVPENNKEREKRDKALIKDYQNGASIVQLVSDYRLTSAGIYKILNRYNIQLNRIKVQDND